jgi:hypothetical protein
VSSGVDAEDSIDRRDHILETCCAGFCAFSAAVGFSHNETRFQPTAESAPARNAPSYDDVPVVGQLQQFVLHLECSAYFRRGDNFQKLSPDIHSVIRL